MISYFKGWKVNDVLAVSAASRAQAGFQFISEILNPGCILRQEATSAPYSRQVNILVSHNFELLLDAGAFISSAKTSEKELINEVKVKHKLDKLWSLITDSSAKAILEIKDVKSESRNIFEYYNVELNIGKMFVIHELKNIRYDLADFRGQESNKLRPSLNEADSMDEIVDFFKNTSKKLCAHLHLKYPQR